MKTFQQLRRQSRARRMVAIKPAHADANRAALQDALGYPVQTKLKVGAPDDVHEREADAVAARVMAMPEGIQRKCENCEQEDAQKKEQVEPEKQDEDIQRKEAGGAATLTSTGATAIATSRGGGRPLPASERAFFEPRLGANLGRVRIHADEQAVHLSANLAARAFTVGSDVYFSSGEYRPGTPEGRRLLAHELVHTLQQGKGRGTAIQRKPCPTASCHGYLNTYCGAYAANAWWLPLAYVNNATLACRETPNHPTAQCVRKTLQGRLAATPTRVKTTAAGMKPHESTNPPLYSAFMASYLTPRIYSDHVYAYRTAGCPAGPASYPAWIAVTTIPMPPGTVGMSIRYGGGSCSGKWGSWC